MIVFSVVSGGQRLKFLLPALLIGQFAFAMSSVHAVEVGSSDGVTQISRKVMSSRPASRPDSNSASNSASTVVNRSPPGNKHNAAKRMVNKALTPIRATVIQLGRPLEWLNSARHYFWPSTLILAKETHYLDRIDAPRLLNVNVMPRSMFSLGGSMPTQTTWLSSLDEFDLSKAYEVVASNHATATELQVRMADDWSMLYILDRPSTDLNGYTVSVGLGLRHSF